MTVYRLLSSGAARRARHPRNWVHKKIPGCAVELNTQNCAWFGSQISIITAMSFREAMPPPEPPTRVSAPGPRWGTSVPQTPCAPHHLQILAAPLLLRSAMMYTTFVHWQEWQDCTITVDTAVSAQRTHSSQPSVVQLSTAVLTTLQ